MTIVFPLSAPDTHREFALRAVAHLSQDHRIVGVAAAGSWADDSMDTFSDLDLVIAVDPEHFDAAMRERQAIAGALGPLLVAFTGEHVAEPRLLVCLYERPLLHVDLKFVCLPDAAQRVDEPEVLWERDGQLSTVYRQSSTKALHTDPQWIEDRFWVWIHYAAGKIARGELYEAVDFISFLRSTVLGPLGLERLGHRPTGVRRIEARDADLDAALAGTIAAHNVESCYAAVARCAELYERLRGARIVRRIAAEVAAMEYLSQLRGQPPLASHQGGSAKGVGA